MKSFESKDIRNVGLLSHGGAGKTSLAEAFLFNAKVTTRLCKVDEQNSNFDFEPEEHKRRATIKATVGAFEWAKRKINLIDTPGDANFWADTRGAAIAMDAAVLLVSGVDGVEVGTDRAWSLLQEANLPRAIFVNKLDRERSDFKRTLAEIHESLTPKAVPTQIPIGSEAGFKGVIRLLFNQAYIYRTDGSGGYDVTDIPAAMKADVAEARRAIVEAVAETAEDLMEKYFEEGDLSQEDLMRGLAVGIRSGSIVPVLCGSATTNVAIHPLLDLIAEEFPSPLDRGTMAGKHPESGADVVVPCTPDAPLSGYVFKTLVDPYAGRLNIVRLFSGSLPGDGVVFDARSGEKERYSTMYALTGKKQDTINGATAGDIVTFAKMKDVATGDTLCDEKAPVVYAGLPRVPAAIAFAIKAKSQGDEDKIGTALARLMEEDPSLELSRNEHSKELLLAGVGQPQVECVVERLKRKFGVEAELSTPKVPYRETIRKPAKAIQGRHKKQTGGRGQFGDCWVDLEPNERGKGFEFIDNIVGGSIPRNYIPAVEKGFHESLERGFLAGFPVVDLKVRLFDGSYHPVDSSEMAFKQAAHIAFKTGMEKASPCLLEPIMEMEIVVPDECMGDVMGDMNSRRGRVLGMDSHGRNQLIRAQAPLSEVQSYANDLRAMTSGRGTFTMQMHHYEEVPETITAKVVAEHKASQE
ncbi:MAG: elongation factor G [Myxococcales bacterium]